MKRALGVVAIAFLLTGCFSAKKALNSAENKVKAKGACLVFQAVEKNYKQALTNSPLADQAGEQFKNGLEALKPLVPTNVQQAASVLRDSGAPVDSSKYTPEQAAARQTLDNYFQTNCGNKL